MSARRWDLALRALAVLGSALLALSVAGSALGAVEHSFTVELHFGVGCSGSGSLRVSDLTGESVPLSWRAGVTRSISGSSGQWFREPLTVQLVDRAGSLLWETTVPWSRPPDGSGPDWSVKAWFDCSSGTLREVAAPDTATIPAIPASDVPARSPAIPALLALAFAAGALLGLVRLERRGTGRRRR